MNNVRVRILKHEGRGMPLPLLNPIVVILAYFCLPVNRRTQKVLAAFCSWHAGKCCFFCSSDGVFPIRWNPFRRNPIRRN